LDESSDYYSLLGVARKATAEEIKRAYRKLVFQYHPDRNPDNQQAAEKLKQIMAAYDTLSKEESRAQYDNAQWSRFQDEKGSDEKAHAGNGSHFSYEFKRTLEPEPRCPNCAAAGMDHVISRKSGSSKSRGKQFVISPFQIIFCDQCGHVYGITGASS
jgi:curved DNA-binding protein CbpA